MDETTTNHALWEAVSPDPDFGSSESESVSSDGSWQVIAEKIAMGQRFMRSMEKSTFFVNNPPWTFPAFDASGECRRSEGRGGGG